MWRRNPSWAGQRRISAVKGGCCRVVAKGSASWSCEASTVGNAVDVTCYVTYLKHMGMRVDLTVQHHTFTYQSSAKLQPANAKRRPVAL